MPSKNVVKTFVKNGYYHIYTRGVEKRNIYEDREDYKVFLNYLEEYLSPPPDPSKLAISFTLKGSTFKGIPRLPKNYYKEIEILAYCLMPNHFHLLVKQSSERSIKSFMQSLNTRYVLYFNKKYKRVGALFQGIYKAVLIQGEAYLLHLSRYIHLNPKETTADIENAFSSYSKYIIQNNSSWIKSEIILNYFNKLTLPGIKKYNSYQKFVENYPHDSSKILGSLTIE